MDQLGQVHGISRACGDCRQLIRARASCAAVHDTMNMLELAASFYMYFRMFSRMWCGTRKTKHI